MPLKNGTDKFKDFFSAKPFLYGYVINYFEEGAGDKFIIEFKNIIAHQDDDVQFLDDFFK